MPSASPPQPPTAPGPEPHPPPTEALDIVAAGNTANSISVANRVDREYRR